MQPAVCEGPSIVDGRLSDVGSTAYTPRRVSHVRLGTRVPRLVTLVVLGLVMTGAATAPPSPDAGTSPASPPKRVLVIYDYARPTPAVLSHEQALTAGLRSDADPVNVYTEYLNLTQLDHKSFPEETAAYLRAKYAPVPPDLLVLAGSRLLRFTLQRRDSLFPGVPIVFTGVERHAAADIVLPDDVSGVWVTPGWAATLDAALKLQPHTTRALIITGASGIDRVWAAAARAQIEPLRRPVEIEYVIGPPLESLLERVAKLPPHTLIVLGPFTRDATGRDFRSPEATIRLAEAASVPAYGLGETAIGGGVVGGNVVSFEAQGARTAELVMRVLRGDRTGHGEIGTNVYRFDARQLRRWGLDRRRLPAGSVLLFDEPSVWRQYAAYIAGGVAVLLLQSALIAALLAQRAHRRRAEQALAERLRFETLLAELSALFASRPSSEVDRHIEDALRRVVEELDVDRATVGQLARGSNKGEITHAWTRPGIPSLPNVLNTGLLPWIVSRVRQGHAVSLARPEDLPPEADVDLKTLRGMHTRSVTVVPLSIGDGGDGFLSVAAIRQERRRVSDLVARLTLLGDVFASALARQRAEQAMEETRRHREELAHVQRVTTLGELAGGLAHEVNQPLAAIVMNAQAADRLLAGTPAPSASLGAELRGALADIVKDSKRAAQIIHGLRSLFRKEEVERRPLDLNGLVEQVVTLLQADFRRRTVRVRLHLDRTIPLIVADAVPLQQVVLNVLVNAGEAVGALEGGQREVTIVTAARSADLIELTVSDTGIGVKDEDLERIFERFVSAKPDGLGMGLAISRSIVSNHGGRIWATRNVDHGVTIHVELPTGR
jgi:signal transduction histidine kinase